MVGTTLVSSRDLGESLEEEGKLGSSVGIEGEEGVTDIGVTEGEGKFKVT